jgi:hypothetical protein
MASQPSKKKKPAYTRRRPWWSRFWVLGGALGVIVIGILAFFVWYSLQPPSPPPSASSAQVIDQATHVPSSVFDSVPATSTALKPAHPPTGLRDRDGKPQVLYIGGEFCPFCAAERWSLVVALSRFGTFSGLSLTTSSSLDIDPNTPTFTFHGSQFKSNVLSFTPVEVLNRSSRPLDPLTPEQDRLQKTYDPQQTVPFVLIGGRYVVLTSGYPPDVLAGRSWGQIAQDLNNPSSGTTKAIVGEANVLSAAICQLTDNKPVAVCSSAGVERARAKLGT